MSTHGAPNIDIAQRLQRVMEMTGMNERSLIGLALGRFLRLRAALASKEVSNPN